MKPNANKPLNTATSSLPTPSISPPPKKTLTADEVELGRDTLLAGLTSLLNRARLLTCLRNLDEQEMESLARAWYEALVGEVPAKYWKEVALNAARYHAPHDKFTVGQFFAAWEQFKGEGKAKGYETWRLK